MWDNKTELSEILPAHSVVSKTPYLSLPSPLTATEVSVCLPILFSQSVRGLTFWQSSYFFFLDEEGIGHCSSFLSWVVQVNYEPEFSMVNMDILQRMKGPALAMAFLLNSHLSFQCNVNLSYCQEQKEWDQLQDLPLDEAHGVSLSWR